MKIAVRCRLLNVIRTVRFASASSVFLIVALGAAHVWAQGNILLIVPPEATGGNDGNSSFAPFSTTMAGRFQQVYSASTFASLLPPGGGLIRDINLRSDASGLPFQSQIGNFQVNLSTTTRNPDNLSPVFDDNVGPDNQVVFGPAAYRIGGGPGGGFNTDIAMNTPFYYNPAAGNLLLDFRVFSGAGNSPAGGLYDAFNVSGDSVSSVSAFGSSLPGSGAPSSLGLATLFVFTSVPEPPSWAVLIAGALCFSLWRKRQRRA